MAASEADVAAKLIQRLLADPAFRSRFRRDPAGACREAGLDELAQEMSLGGGKAMHTLDLRESKSSLAGVMMAAAMEGVGIYELTENVLPHLEEVPGHIADVLSRVNLPAIHHGGGGGGAAAVDPSHAAGPANGGGVGDAGSSVPTPPAATPDQHADAATSGSTAAPSGSAAAAPAKPASGGSGSGAAADAATGRARGGSRGGGSRAAAPPEVAPKSSAAKKAAKKIADSLSPRTAHKQAASGAAAALDSQTTGLPESSDLPAGGGSADVAASAGAPPAGAAPELGGAPPPDAAAAGAPPADTTVAPGGGAATLPDSAHPGLEATDATAPPEAVHHAAAAVADAPQGAGTHHGVDPSQFGQGGTGGPPDAEAMALLHNKNVVLDAQGIADIRGGRVDPRVVGVLTKLGQEHRLTISSISSDHPRFTTGGSVSNHYLGRGVDIAAIDGHIVDAGNPIAREVASELSSLEPGIRPTEIGSPWAISGPGYFTDAAHHNHLHIGFKQPIPADWRPPADVAAPGDPTAAAGAGAGKAVAAASGAPPATDGSATGTADAAPPEAAAPPAAVAATPPPAVAATPPAGAPPGPPAGRDSQAFLQALDPQSRAPAHGASQAFLKAVDPKAAAGPPGTAPAGTPAATADAATAGAPGATADAAVSSFTDTTYPGDDASQAQIAAWMAAEAQKRGLPPQLPVMASLVESGVKNLNFGDRDSVGFFQMRVGTWNEGPYAGFADHPELQVKWFLDQAEAVKAQRIARGESVTDPHQFGDWIADVERPAEQYRGRYQLRLDEANGLLAHAPPAAAAAPAAAAITPAPAGALVDAAGAPTAAGGGASPLGAAALRVAETQKGVREIGSTNTGPQVDHYLQAAGVPPGNPWCASFVTWSLGQAGHKMPGGGWAAVSTWVRNAESGTNGLKIVSADQAQPGDIVAYDWGGGTDFSGDGHIGFLASNVNNGQFNALEGNNADAVNLVPRHLGGGPNIVFIHVDGTTTAGATPTPPADPTAAAASAATAGTPASAAAAAAPAAPAPKGSLAFLKALDPQSQAPAHGASQTFLKAVDPQAAGGAGPGAPAAGAAAAAPGAPVADAATATTPGGAADAAAGAFTDTTYPGDDASQAQIAAWMAAEAQKRGLPPQLPVMASLVESGVKNLNFGDRDSVGFFQMRVGTWNEGPYAGFADHPELQVKWFLDQAEAVKAQRIARGESVTDPHQFGDWIADVERPAEQYRGRYQLRLDEANGLLAHAPPAAAAAPAAAAVTPAPAGALVDAAGAPTAAGGGASPLGAAALRVAETQKGVREIGSTNTGPQVDHYLQAAGVPPGNPWCASFVTWSLGQAGHKMPGGGWAAVSTWVRNAESGTNGLKIVSADQAQPGDIVAYDWGGGTDFSGDGHIGFLASNVNNGQFNALEGNNADAVNLVPRHLGGGPNIVFIHVDGTTTAGATPTPPADPTAAAASAATAGTPASAAAAATTGAEPPHRPHDSLQFEALVKQDPPKSGHSSAMFLKAIDPSQQVKSAAGTPPPAPAAAPPGVAPAAATPPEAAPAAAAAPADAGTGAPAVHAAAASIDLTDAATAYPGDNASQAQLAQWLGHQAQQAGLPPELPVMASLVESGVKNVHFGDRDSVGFFQMRVGIWNQGAYAGFADHPELQAKWFIDHALAVKRQAIAAGDANFGRDPSKFGEWIADVERPAEQYRGRYQLRLDEARKLLGG